MDISNIQNLVVKNKETTLVITISCFMAGYTSTVIYSVLFLLSVVAYVSLTNRGNSNDVDQQQEGEQKKKNPIVVKKSTSAVTVEKKIASPVKVLPQTPPPKQQQQQVNSAPSTPTPPPPIPPRPKNESSSSSTSSTPNGTPTKQNVVGGQLSNSFGSPASSPSVNPSPLARKNTTQSDLSYTPPSSPSPSSSVGYGSKSAPSSPATGTTGYGSPSGSSSSASNTPTLKKISINKDNNIDTTSNNKENDKKDKKVGMSTLRGLIGGVVGKKTSSSTPSSPSLTPEEKEKNDTKRKQISEEILSTERAYVGKLKIISEVFYIPLKTAATANPHPPLSLDQVHTVFSEILTIYNYNSHFLTALEDKMKSSSNLLIGDTFIEITAYLKTYTVYINNYSKAVATLEKARKNQNFDLLLQKFTHETPACDGLDLTSLLIMPVQRIPRYILLLQELLKVTDKKEKEYASLNTALTKMKELASDMNENRRQAELLNSMYDLQNRLDGFKGDFIVPARKLLMEGDFQEKVFSTTSNSAVTTSSRRYILCSDILLRTKVKGKKLIVKEVVDVSGIQFKDLAGEPLAIHPQDSNEIYALKAISPDESSNNLEDKWKEAIIHQQKVLKDNEHQRRQSIGKTN